MASCTVCGGDLRGVLQDRRHLLIHRLQEAQRLLELRADHRDVRGVDLLRQGRLEHPHEAVPAVDDLVHDAVQADAAHRRGEIGHDHRGRRAGLARSVTCSSKLGVVGSSGWSGVGKKVGRTMLTCPLMALVISLARATTAARGGWSRWSPGRRSRWRAGPACRYRAARCRRDREPQRAHRGVEGDARGVDQGRDGDLAAVLDGRIAAMAGWLRSMARPRVTEPPAASLQRRRAVDVGDAAQARGQVEAQVHVLRWSRSS